MVQFYKTYIPRAVAIFLKPIRGLKARIEVILCLAATVSCLVVWLYG